MLDVAWSEILVIIIVAVILIKPKDLPIIAKAFGRIIRKIESWKREASNLATELTGEDTESSKLSPPQTPIKYLLDMEGKMRVAYDVSELNKLRAKNNAPETFDDKKTVH
jgi:sec-independent protein translocase protein TatB